jgi:hypothetical protein
VSRSGEVSASAVTRGLGRRRGHHPGRRPRPRHAVQLDRLLSWSAHTQADALRERLGHLRGPVSGQGSARDGIGLHPTRGPGSLRHRPVGLPPLPSKSRLCGRLPVTVRGRGRLDRRRVALRTIERPPPADSAPLTESIPQRGPSRVLGRCAVQRRSLLPWLKIQRTRYEWEIGAWSRAQRPSPAGSGSRWTIVRLLVARVSATYSRLSPRAPSSSAM